MSKKSIHEVTKSLSKLVTNRTIVEPRNKKKDKEKKFDDGDKIDVDQKQTSDEYNSDEFEGDENES